MMTLRRRLLLTLLPALALLMVLGGIADYWVAAVSTRDAYDQALASSALTIAANLNLTQGADPADGSHHKLLKPNPNLESALDANLYRVTGAGGEVIAGNRELPAAPGGFARVTFADASYRGEQLRLASLRLPTEAGTVVVTAAESRARRLRTQRVMLFGKLLVDFAELDITLLLIWIAVYYGLRPVEALRDQVESSRAFSAAPLNAPRRLDETHVPGELRSTVVAFNRVLELLQDAAAVQQRFVADAAHQMRTPVAGLLAQLELLLEDPNAAPLSAQLKTIQTGIQQLAHSANQLLALARAEPVAAMHEKFAPLDLRPLVEALALRYLDRADRARIDLGVEASDVKVVGDSWLLEDLLGNLVDNALKYTPAGGRVTVRCGRRGERPFLEVEDNGPGIPVADRQRVKERFYRRPGSPGIGCGLGLAIVEEIARLHQADFTISGGAQERGCLMQVRFPTFN
jgi:two-component system sensor histidine kinase TctE